MCLTATSKDKNKRILIILIGNNFLCIDEKAWQQLFDAFKTQWKDGNRSPKLPDIDLEII